MVTVRRRWPDPRTGEVIDQSKALGPANLGSRRSLDMSGVGVGHMTPNKRIDGVWKWNEQMGRGGKHPDSLPKKG